MTELNDKVNGRCPKCRKQNFFMTVIRQEEISADVRNGEIITSGHSALSQPVRRHGECYNCGHKWAFRDPEPIALISTGLSL